MMKKRGKEAVAINDTYSMQVIARIRSEFPSKFGIPRQSGLVEALESTVVLEPQFRAPEALRGLEGFSHIWLIWGFSAVPEGQWSPTVRPPRLGGNVRMGVFATRSPFRPNPIGLSSVRLESIELTETLGPVLHLRGADLMDGTPIFDIKPYLPYCDSHPDALGGFAAAPAEETLEVCLPPELSALLPAQLQEPLRGVLAQDPRPHYQQDPHRQYGFRFSDWEIRFTVEGSVLTVRSISPADPASETP